MKFLFFLFCAVFLYAQNSDYSLRLSAGKSSASDFDQLYTFGGLNPSRYNTDVYGITAGYRVVENLLDLPLDIYSSASLNYFDENGYQENFFEGDIYIKLYIKLNFFSNLFRYGIAEGVSYGQRVPYVEAQEAIEEGDNQSKFLNYMEMTYDFDMGKLLGIRDLEGYYLGYLIKHRSGAQGSYGGVRDGGSNYNALYIEKQF